MTNLLKMLMGAILALTISSANASLINGVDYGDGLILQTGSVFFNNENDVSYGIGTVDTIWDDGVVVWQTGDNDVEYNFVFDDILRIVTGDVGVTGYISYGDTFGRYDFYSNDIGTFEVTGNYDSDKAVIESGTLNLSAVGHEVSVGVYAFSITGDVDADSNSGSGQVDIVSGYAYPIIVQDSLIRTDGTFADATFNFSSDNLQTFGYDWSGSVDVAMVTQQVPEPSSILLMGLGLIGFIGSRKLV